MVWIILILVALLILAPAYALLPSARQKNQMFMRKAAMAEGIGVELTHIEDPDPDPDKYLTSTGKPMERKLSVAAYRLPRAHVDSWKKQKRLNWVLVKSGKDFSDLPGGWQWEEGDAHLLPAALSSFIEDRIVNLPGDVIRIDERNGILSLYWHESDEEDAVGRVIDFLKDCTVIILEDPENSTEEA